ncbi:hypothetical protein [Acetobacter cibinongensis]|uniref:Uncharacterized protein n=1 Tax=Acetobacter cibinongensis TaxID=146475 RepID=A0A1Z5YW19_9PROT|nr:hypothetical protein [Acetobacter cibinongensis]OUJ03163.1 hypothetical protein HK14_03075 [Acetobacter cibinongensis]
MRTREQQIASLAAAIYTGAAKMPHALKEAETYILEAERRAEQRVRAETANQEEYRLSKHGNAYANAYMGNDND